MNSEFKYRLEGIKSQALPLLKNIKLLKYTVYCKSASQ